jgi:hypothetical protein
VFKTASTGKVERRLYKYGVVQKGHEDIEWVIAEDDK